MAWGRPAGSAARATARGSWHRTHVALSSSLCLSVTVPFRGNRDTPDVGPSLELGVDLRTRMTPFSCAMGRVPAAARVGGCETEGLATARGSGEDSRLCVWVSPPRARSPPP